MLLCRRSSYPLEAAPRAVQFYERGVAPRSTRQAPAAFDRGTSLIFYTPAVTDASLTLSLELAFDSFPDEWLEKLSGGLQALSGLPIFLPYAGYLMIGSQLAKFAGDLGRAFLEGDAEFTRTETLDFDLPGFDRPEAAFRIVANPSFDVSGLGFVPRKALVVASDPAKPYDGDEPYGHHSRRPGRFRSTTSSPRSPRPSCSGACSALPTGGVGHRPAGGRGAPGQRRPHAHRSRSRRARDRDLAQAGRGGPGGRAPDGASRGTDQEHPQRPAEAA
jgi:hypothetical protein